MTWSVSNRTDGIIEIADLALIPHMTDAAPSRLVTAGLWKVIGETQFLITDYEGTQTSRDDLEKLANMRRRGRDNKRRQRAKAAAQDDVTGTVPKDVPPDKTEDPTRTGQDRPGQAKNRTNDESVNDEKSDNCLADDNPTSRELGDWCAAGAAWEPPATNADGFPIEDV